ncbi:hypothetical protein XELAEV_18014797mg [Xenopus laevis]|uniref:Uncharacterized protein n=1 Tax=Xenopus laevis TaxID=8355 RepID=A0A974DGU4_XENLA|nr:hypothetical protein XELAEV_18014797mg [Xenopus laevis]
MRRLPGVGPAPRRRPPLRPLCPSRSTPLPRPSHPTRVQRREEDPGAVPGATRIPAAALHPGTPTPRGPDSTSRCCVLFPPRPGAECKH